MPFIKACRLCKGYCLTNRNVLYYRLSLYVVLIGFAVPGEGLE